MCSHRETVRNYPWKNAESTARSTYNTPSRRSQKLSGTVNKGRRVQAVTASSGGRVLTVDPRRTWDDLHQALKQLEAAKAEQREKTPVLSPILWRLDHLLQLREDWDGEGAGKISRTAIGCSLRLIAKSIDEFAITPVLIAPIPDGGLQLEWENATSRLELLIDPDGEMSMLFIDRPGTAQRSAVEKEGLSAESVIEAIREVAYGSKG